MSQQKGKAFERETAALAGISPKGVSYGKRIAKSGAFGTTEGIPQMAGDARWMLPWLDSEIHLECKHGYDDDPKQKSFRIYREWFDKHMNQAKAFDFYPAFAFKFKLTKQDGMSKMVLIPFPVMERVLSVVNNMHQEIEELQREVVMWEKGIKTRKEE